MSKRVSLAGVLLALNCLVYIAINAIPINTLFLMLLGSFLPAIIVMEFGERDGIIYTIGAMLLALLLINDKSEALLCMLYFCPYGIVKNRIERYFARAKGYIVKLVYANIILFITAIIINILIAPVVTIIGASGKIWVLILFILMMQIFTIGYDYLYSSFISYWRHNKKKFM